MKNQVESIKAKLRTISKQWNKNHQVILVRYFQERFLCRLSKSKYQKHFFLKGGVLIYALEREISRPTLDLDLLAHKVDGDIEKVKTIFQEICSIEFNDGVIFEIESIQPTEIIKEGNYSGIRIKVMVGLGNIKQNLQIDIGFGDVIIPGPVRMNYPTLIELDSPEIFAYSIESLVAEKFEAMIDLAELNSRMKDFYDIYRILVGGKIDWSVLEEAIKQTFLKRGTPLSTDHILFKEVFHTDQKRNNQWQAFLKKSKLEEDLSFIQVMQIIKEKLLPIYNRIK